MPPLPSNDRTGPEGSPPGAVFGHLADDYDEARPAYSAELWPLIDRFVGGLADRDVLDLAAGTGLVSRELITRGSRVVAAEADRLQLRRLRQRSPDASAVVARAERLPFIAGAFDIVACGTAWHWLDAADASVEASRVLRPGGWLTLFWANHFRSIDDAWQAAELQVYDRWARRWGSRPATDGGLRPDQAAADLGRRGWDVQLDTVLRWTRDVTREEHVRTLSTHSIVIFLGEDRTRFLDEITAALQPWPRFTEHLHGNVVLARRPAGA